MTLLRFLGRASRFSVIRALPIVGFMSPDVILVLICLMLSGVRLFLILLHDLHSVLYSVCLVVRFGFFKRARLCARDRIRWNSFFGLVSLHDVQVFCTKGDDR
jgi:hypothetical protein